MRNLQFDDENVANGLLLMIEINIINRTIFKKNGIFYRNTLLFNLKSEEMYLKLN